MLSIEVVKKKKLSRRVESSARTHRRLISKGLEAFYAPFAAEGFALPDFEPFLQLQARVLRHLRLELQTRDRAHEAELQNDKELRRVRDEAARKLHAKLGEICNTVDGTYGKGRCEELLGFSTGLRPEPEQMLEVAEKAVERLSAPSFRLPSPQLDGVELEIDSLKDELVDPLTDLATAIKALDREKDKFDATVTAKKEAFKAHHQAYVRLSRLLEELYRIAGHPDLADRLRPPSHRAKGTQADEAGTDGDTSSDAATATDGADDAEPEAADAEPAEGAGATGDAAS